MPSTPTYAFPYPALTDPPNGAAQIQALATQVESKLSITDANVSTVLADTAKVGGEWRASAQQNLATGANKLTFATNVVSPTGITFNGTDTWTIVTSGVYTLFAQLRTTATGQDGALAFSGTSYSDGTLLFPGSVVNSIWGDIGHSATGYLTAGTSICAYYYNNEAATTTAFATRPPMFKIWRVAGA
ncbi:hypothetical protein ACIA2T_19650 [Amycolatopsis japonica]|uniref:hypothetical protein n=1 Tax=Amycolatopsis japonica TaxID=208439 RepID=UPI0037B1E324